MSSLAPLVSSPCRMDNPRRSSRCDRLLTGRTLDEHAPLIVYFVGDEDDSTAQIALTERVSTTIGYRIGHGGGKGESPGACDIPRDSTLGYAAVQLKAEGTGVKVTIPRRTAPSRSHQPRAGQSTS